MNSAQSNFDSSQTSENRQQPVDAETDVFWSTVVRCLFPSLVCLSLSIGYQVPLLYDLSGADQSRTPPIIKYAFGGLLIVCCVSLLALRFLPKVKPEEPVFNPLIQPFRFLRSRIVLVTMIAGLLVYRDATIVIIGATSFIYPILCAIKLGMACRYLRWRIVSLYSCMYLPFVWVFTNDVFQSALKQGSFVFLPLLAGAPGLLCYLYISQFFGEQQGFAMLIAVGVAGLEALFGLRMIQLGARRAIAYLILLLAVSVITSFGFHGVLRM